MSLHRRSLDVGLLVLRIGAGLSSCWFFGVDKVKAAALFPSTEHWPLVDFNRRMGIPAPVLAAYCALAFTGPGSLSIDSLLRRRRAVAHQRAPRIDGGRHV